MARAPSIVRESLKVRVQSGFKNPLVVRDGEGCYIKDVDNKKYLDFHSIVCTNNVGYGRPELKEVIKQYSKRGVYKIDGTFFYTEEALILAKKVLKTLPHSQKKVFFMRE